jgi:hypothetical protein
VLSTSAGPLDFGVVRALSSSPPLTFTVTNTGSAVSPAPRVSLVGAHPADFGLTTTCAAGLALGERCDVTVTFTPVSVGLRSARVEVQAGAAAASMDLVGTGGVELTVALDGLGSVTSDVGDLECPATRCAAVFAPGTVVTLTASAASTTHFLTWSAPCAGAGTCPVSLNTTNAAVTARFVPIPVVTLTRAPPPGHTNDNLLSWEFTADLFGSTFECTVDGVTSSCTSPHQRAFSNTFEHSFSVVAISPDGVRSAPASTRTFTATSGPLLEYAFDGDVQNSGRLTGFSGTSTGVTTVPGKYGQALRVDGVVGSGITIPGLASVLGSSSRSWTLAVWFKEDAPQLRTTLLNLRTSRHGFETYHGAVSATQFTTCAGPSSGLGSCFSFSSVTSNVWHQLVYEYTSADYRQGAPLVVTIDGVRVGTLNATELELLFGTTLDKLELGHRTGTLPQSSTFALDRLRVYDTVFPDGAQRCNVILGGTWVTATRTCTLP